MYKEDFGAEDIEEYEKQFEQQEDAWDEWDLEETLHAAQPKIVVGTVMLVGFFVPFILVLWLAAKMTFLAIVVTVLFACLLVFSLYRSIRMKANWKNLKDHVLPELKSEDAVHFHKIQISVTNHYVVTWSYSNLHVFKIGEVEKLIGKKGQMDAHNHKYNDMLLLKRPGKIPTSAGQNVDYTEVKKANELIEQRKK